MTTTPATPGTAPATPAGIAVDGLPAEIDVLVVGAGFGGLAALHRLRTDHPSLSVLAVERAAEAGGVWLANTYPGAACDVPTALYSLSFADNPNWSHTFGRQWEIRQYATKVAADYATSSATTARCSRRHGMTPPIAGWWTPLTAPSGPDS